jgi:hypothetical protein
MIPARCRFMVQPPRTVQAHNIPRGATAANSHANNGSASKQGDEEGEILEETSLDVGISTKVGESGENTVSL